MNSLAYSRVSVDVFRPSRNYIDVIKGIPIIIEKRNGFRDDLTQRSDSIRPVFNKLESIVKNPLLRMSIEGARINLAVVQNDKFELIPPEKPSKIIVYFENLMNLLVPYSIAESLNELSFEGSYYGQNIVSEVVWALFVIDFISNFFWIKRISGQNLHSKKAITKHYLKTWALFDLISLIPLRWSGNLNAEACLKLIRVLKLGRVRRMLKIDNLSRYLIQKLTKSHKRHIRTEFCITSIWELVLKISVMAHISYSFGCIWWYWSDLMYRYNYTSQNFINYYGLNEKSKNEQGVITTYYIVTSVLTIGYGDYSSTNIYEMGITIFCLMLSVLVFSSLMNTATTLISILSDSLKNKKNSRKNEKILNILKASHEEFPLKLKDSISNFFVYYSKTDRLGSLAKSYKNQRDAKKIMKRQDNIFKPLPVRLKRKILDTLFNDYFAYFRRIFSDKSDFKYHICSFLIPRRFFDGEIIIQEGIKCKELYLIMKGVVSLNFKNDLDELITCKEFSGKYTIGDHCVFLNKPSFGTFKAEEIVSGLFIPEKPFKIIIKAYFKDHLSFLKRSTIRRSTELINLMGKCGFLSFEEILEDLNNKTKKSTTFTKKNLNYSLSIYELYKSFKNR